MFAKDTIYIAGSAKTQHNNAITIQFGQFFIGFVINRQTGNIIACDASATLSVTNEFIRSLLVGKNIQADTDIIRQEIEDRYFGSSQKAILVAYKDAQKQFINIQQGAHAKNVM